MKTIETVKKAIGRKIIDIIGDFEGYDGNNSHNDIKIILDNKDKLSLSSCTNCEAMFIDLNEEKENGK